LSQIVKNFNKLSASESKISSFAYKYLKAYYPEEFKDINLTEDHLYNEKVFVKAQRIREEVFVLFSFIFRKKYNKLLELSSNMLKLTIRTATTNSELPR
jgi:hypothetical protein